MLADCEDVDAELASLIKRNQSSLAGIKRDLQAAKREAWTASRDGSGGAGTAAGSRRCGMCANQRCGTGGACFRTQLRARVVPDTVSPGPHPPHRGSGA